MKKVALYLMPLLLILALFGYWIGSDLTLHGLFNELKNMNFELPNLQELGKSFNNLQFTNIWGNVASVWEDVRELFTAIYAIGRTIYALFESVVEIGKMIYYVIEFIIEIITNLVSNFIEIATMMYNYLFNR